MNPADDTTYMHEAIAEAQLARAKGEVPIGAVIVHQGQVIGRGHNLRETSNDPTSHAEMVAISLAQESVDSWNLGADGAVQLVTSCEPCAMCFGAAPWSGVGSLVWGARREDAEAAGFDEGDKPADWEQSLERRGIRTCGDVLRTEAAAVLADYAGGDGAIYNP